VHEEQFLPDSARAKQCRKKTEEKDPHRASEHVVARDGRHRAAAVDCAV